MSDEERNLTASAARELRDSINNWHPTNARLLADEPRWLKVCVHMKSLDDGIRNAYGYEATANHAKAVSDLFVALRLQDESVSKLSKLTGAGRVSDDRLDAVRDIRNKLLHPDKGYSIYDHLVDRPKFHLVKAGEESSADDAVYDAVALRSDHSAAIRDACGAILSHLSEERSRWAEGARERGDFPLADAIKGLDYQVGTVGDRDRKYEAIQLSGSERQVSNLRSRMERLEYADGLVLFDLGVMEGGLRLWRNGLEGRTDSESWFVERGLRAAHADLLDLVAGIDKQIACLLEAAG